MIDMNIALLIKLHPMTYEQLIKHFKTQQKAADALGIKQPSICAWGGEDGIPELRQFQIQLITGGVLQADPIQKKAA